MKLLDKVRSFFKGLKRKSKLKDETEKLENKFDEIITENKQYIYRLVNVDKIILSKYISSIQDKKTLPELTQLLNGEKIIEEILPQSSSVNKKNKCNSKWVEETFSTFDKIFLIYQDLITAFSKTLADVENKCVKKFSNTLNENYKLNDLLIKKCHLVSKYA